MKLWRNFALVACTTSATWERTGNNWENNNRNNFKSTGMFAKRHNTMHNTHV